MGRTKLRLALPMAYVFLRWAAKAEFFKYAEAQFGLAAVLCMARCGKSAMIFRRNRKIVNCNEFRLGIQPQ